MSDEDRENWDHKHSRSMPAPVIEPPPPPPVFAHVAQEFPREGRALELGCGRGEGAAWLAWRGLEYHGVDVSPVAVEATKRFLGAYGLIDRCRLEVWDLDEGLPPGDNVDLLFCHMFRDPDLYAEMIDRVAPGGLLAVAMLSEVEGTAGGYRAPAGELRRAFGHLDLADEGENQGIAWILARKP